MRFAVAVLGTSLALLALVGAQPQDVSFTDVTSQAGVAFTNVNGASTDKHLPETMGSGAAFVDLDADGWPDIFLVDGGSMADPQVARRAQHRVLRNRRNGTFEDVTTASGIRHGDYGMGVCAGDYDGDGKVEPGIWRGSATPNASTFWSLNSTNGAATPFALGANGDYAPANFNTH